MCKLYMGLWEILQDYRAAKDKNAMITILADRNCCDFDDIVKILIDNGETVNVVKKEKKQKAAPPPSGLPCKLDEHTVAKALNLYKIQLQKDRSEILQALKELEEEFSKVEKSIASINEITKEREAK